MPTRLTLSVMAVLLAMTRVTHAERPQPDPQDLRALTIEQLMDIDVTLAAREPEPVRNASAAIDVITSDQIRRAGVTTIADAIALADGVQVARFNNGTWAISARGFNATAANKMLVMVDGRTEFSPLFSGTFWNVEDYVLADIDRIEVIRGPGAALWGANAVNGVINIVTRHSKDTQGTYVSLGSGNEDPALAEVRYGGTVGQTSYRAFGKFASRDQQIFNTGDPSGDTTRRGQGGFRLDGHTNAGTWMLKGDVLRSHDDLPDRPHGEFTLVGVQGAWSHTARGGSRIDVTTYYRREDRRVPLQLTHAIDTVDIDAQHGFVWNGRHRMIWGGGFRVNSDHTTGGTVQFVPADRIYPFASAFAQDEFTIRPDRVYVTGGLRLERNTFSGLEWQPTVRARANINPRQMVWGALSRAVRRPTRLDVDVRAFTPAGMLVAIGGGDDYRSEKLVAAEFGYRIQASVVAVDATVYRHRYTDLRSQELPATGPPIVVGNTLEGNSHGLEMSATVQPIRAWQIHAGYTFLGETITHAAGSRDIGGAATEGNDPRHQFNLRTSIDLPHAIEVDAFLRSVGALTRTPVPAYTELDARLGWRMAPRTTIALVGQDLLHDHHAEFGDPLPRRVEFQRSLRAIVTFGR